ncbi:MULTISPECIES: RES family NAD+ phosphorylase [unclassified Dietzia]|uniref:RES family NAD+ phosphorylase n=1 Tax=unclassified Dietzia TaxID=2617939 RepID=UPI0015F9FB6C|nr:MULTISPECIES: RES family NAD+ phosphorylase [unclassified Dietzia]MBB1052530.1 RES family NAD+ phosphorylase [Dietzia sp. CW19]MBB1055674.1 RES family NAD+ phosphorylase [Dietzia sp. B44]
MDSLANRLAGQSPVRIAGEWHRHLPARFSDRAMEGRTSYSRWGRDRGFPVLYLGRPTDSVIVEAYRHLVDPVVDDPDIRHHLAPRAMVTAKVDVGDVLDLRSASARAEVGLALRQMQSGTEDRHAYTACQEVAAAAHQQGFHGLVAPAATQRGETLALFSDRLAESELPVIIETSPWNTFPDDPRLGPRLRLVSDN